MPLSARANPRTRLYAKDHRRNPTEAEAALWGQLRRKQIGCRVKRQVVILGWIVDFYCPKLRLAIELDGSSHAGREAEDARRDATMNRHGISVLRVPNSAAFGGKIPGLLSELVRSIPKDLS